MIQVDLQDWGRWKRQTVVNLDIFTHDSKSEPEEVFNEELCTRINIEWLRLQYLHSLQYNYIESHYRYRKSVKEMAIFHDVANDTIRKQLQQAESWLAGRIYTDEDYFRHPEFKIESGL